MLSTDSLALAKARKLTITAHEARLERSMATVRKQILRWIRRANKQALDEEINRLRSAGKVKTLQRVSKAAGSTRLEDQVARILATFGIREADASGKDIASRLDTSWAVPPSMVQELIGRAKTKAKGLAGETRARMQRVVRDTLQQALKEKPVPSIAEISRRLRGQLNTTTSLASDAHRAERIALTEAAQAQNTGIMRSMELAEVDEVEWLARSDGRSGDRHHERMSGKRIPMSASKGSDRSKWFLTPLGNRLPYPCWPGGAAEDIIRCRCTIVPVIRRGRRKLSPGKDVPHSSVGGRSGTSRKVLNP